MENMRSDIEGLNALQKPTERLGITLEDREYLGELNLSEKEWENLDLDSKINHARLINSRIDELQSSTGISRDLLFKECFPDIQFIKMRQNSWDGKVINGLEYAMQSFVGSTGKMYRGVFPRFPAKIEISLPDRCMSDIFWNEYGNRSDREQMRCATVELKKMLIATPDLKERIGLTDQQYSDIMNERDKITGLTWHHDIDFGRMKLVDEKVHSFKEHPHTGGMATWNKQWIEEHLASSSDVVTEKNSIEFEERTFSKYTSDQLDYVKEMLPFGDNELLAMRIDELENSYPPKAIDVDCEIAKLLEPFKEQIDSIYLEAPQDFVQIEEVAKTMDSMEGADYNEWKELSFDKRMEVLQQLENNIAEIAHRPSCEVCAKKLGDGHMGYYSQDSNKIVINSDFISSNSEKAYNNVLETLVHEGRHAYQCYNLYEREVHPRQGEISNWRMNEIEYGYQDVKHFGFKIYEMQPVEADARAFSEDVFKSYMDKKA